MFGGDKTGISRLFFKHCEQTDHHPAMQHHFEKVEAIEVLDCTYKYKRVIKSTNEYQNIKKYQQVPKHIKNTNKYQKCQKGPKNTKRYLKSPKTTKKY